jgi:hypothetical protein
MGVRVLLKEKIDAQLVKMLPAFIGICSSIALFTRTSQQNFIPFIHLF